MLTQIDLDKIVDYFSVQSCLWMVGQHCTGNFLLQCWHRQISYRLAIAIGRLAIDIIAIGNFPAKTCLWNLDQHCTSIFLCNVVPAWLI